MKKFLIRNIPEDLHKDLKTICADKKINMGDCILSLIEKYVQKERQKI